MTTDAPVARRIAVTGGHGFRGWHTARPPRARHGIAPGRLGRAELADQDALDGALTAVDAVIHVAGVNRAESDDEVEQGNVVIAEALGDALGRQRRPMHISYANSIQSAQDNPYGRGKRRAAEV